MLSLELVAFLVAACYLQLAFCQIPDPNDFCFGCQSRRNHKDLYANPGDCHTYFQCFYNEDGTATGILRNCPPLTFWHDRILQCLPEGRTPCIDRCLDPIANTGDCYADSTSCSTYFVCDNTASVQFCCPKETRFNATSCGCDADSTCTDTCIQPTRPPTTENPATSDGLTCIDSFGNTLQAVVGNPGQFQLISSVGDGTVYTMNCAFGTTFSLEACRCDLFSDDVPTGPSNKQCSLYIPFDDSFADHSTNRFTVFQYGDVQLIQNSSALRGSGVAFFNGGHLEIPGLKTFSPGKAASFCFFYLCPNASNCGQGGLLSNRKGSNPGDEFSFFAASLQGGNNANAGLSTTQGAASLTFEDKPWLNYYTHVCVVYDGATVTAYSNNFYQTIVAQQALSGDVTVGSCPFVVGTDQVFGDFIGYIDEVLVCDRALTRFEVNAHFAGRPSMQNAGLIPREISFPSYDSISAQPSPKGACGHNKYWNSGEQLKTTLGIYGGSDARPDEFPFAAALISPNEEQLCSGAVLSEKYVITEGSCCSNWQNATDGGVSSLVVYLGVGETGWPEFITPGSPIPPPKEYAFKRGASRFIYHPSYAGWNDAGVTPYDICLVELSSPVTFDSWKVQPICLPSSCDDTCQPGENTLLSGFGVLSGGWYNWYFLPNREQFNVVPIVGNAECVAALQLEYPGLSVSDLINVFCAGFVTKDPNVGTGMGDDGTALACYKNGYFSLNGIMSIQWGNPQPFVPIVYAKVCDVVGWLKSYIG